MSLWIRTFIFYLDYYSRKLLTFFEVLKKKSRFTLNITKKGLLTRILLHVYNEKEIMKRKPKHSLHLEVYSYIKKVWVKTLKERHERYTLIIITTNILSGRPRKLKSI